MKNLFTLLISFSTYLTLSAQNFTYPTTGNAVNNQLSTLISSDGVHLVTTIRSFGCAPGGASTFRFGTDHVSTGAIYRNTSWAVGCINSVDLIKFDFTTTSIRPLGMRFSIFDVDNGSDSVSVSIFSGGQSVNYTCILYTPTFISVYGTLPSLGFVGSASNNSGLDDNRGRVDITATNNLIRVDSILVFKYNNRNIAGNPSQSFAGFNWSSVEVLPVKLMYFNGSIDGNEVLFNWKATEEKGSAFYHLEYSEDGIRFFKFSSNINAKGTMSGEAVYSYRNAIPSTASSLLFRLVSTDEDERKYYSKTIQIRQKSKFYSAVFPTVFNDGFSLTLLGEKELRGTIFLTDMNGRTPFRKEIELPPGNSIISIDALSSLPKGLYMVTGHFNDAILFSHKIIKQ